MKIKIHKYRLAPNREDIRAPCVIEMPYEAHLLDAGYSALEPVIWAMFDVDFEQRLTKRVFHVMLADEEYEIDYNKVKYFRTIKHPTSLIWFHIFQEAW